MVFTTTMAQTEKGLSSAEGWVIDDITSQALPYVNIYFQNTSIGTISDEDGKYKIKTRNHNDTLVFSMMGYHDVKVFVEHGKKYSLIVRLEEDTQLLDEVVISPTENPAHEILRNIVKNKPKNDPEKFEKFNCQTYTKLNVSISNVSQENLKFLFPSFLVKTLPVKNDSVGRPYLPFYLTEKISNNFIDNERGISQTKEILNNKKGIIGMDMMDIKGYQNSLSAELNLYNNYVDLFGHTFISPLANNALGFYRFYLEDSIIENSRVFYRIRFVPKREKDLAFSGHFIVVKDLWAITQIDATLPRSANINYLNTFKTSFDFEFVNDSTLFFKSNRIKVSFNYFKQKDEFDNAMIEVDKVTLYSNIVIGEDARLLNDSVPEETLETLENTVLNSYRNTTKFNDFEDVSETIDSTNNLPWVKATTKFTQMFVTGYFNVGKIDLGPYLGTFQRNPIEGKRFNIGLRTSEKFNPHYSLGGKIGYGTRDEKWKYGFNGNYKLNSKKRTIIGVNFVKDLYLFGVYSHIHLIKENMISTGEDSFIASIFKRYQSDRRAMLFRYEIFMEREWRRGFNTKVKYEYDEMRKGVYVPFIHNGEPLDYIFNNALSVNLRFSWKENISDIYLRRYYLNTFYPVVNVLLTGGQYTVAGDADYYLKLHLTLKHKIAIGFMRLNYVFETGQIFGSVPFPLLNIVRGNDTYGDSKYRFNMLNNATAALDKYASVMAEHHFNGLIMNKIPLIRAMNIRAIVSVKYLVGSLSNRHNNVLEYPWDMQMPGNQYLEIGAGFENIFKLVRIEAIWRPVPVHYPNMPNHGIRLRVDFAM